MAYCLRRKYNTAMLFIVIAFLVLMALIVLAGLNAGRSDTMETLQAKTTPAMAAHLYMTVICEFATMALFVWLFYRLQIPQQPFFQRALHALPLTLQKLASVAVIFGVMGGGMLCGGLAMSLIPVACPKCHSKARLAGNFPFAYQCSSCGYTHKTALYAAGRR